MHFECQKDPHRRNVSTALRKLLYFRNQHADSNLNSNPPSVIPSSPECGSRQEASTDHQHTLLDVRPVYSHMFTARHILIIF